MRVLYFHQHFSTPKGAAGIRSYEMARRLVARGHQVTMVCGSYGLGETGLSAPFAKGVRRGNVDGIDIVEFDLAYSNADGFVKRAMTFVKFALRSVKLALTETRLPSVEGSGSTSGVLTIGAALFTLTVAEATAESPPGSVTWTWMVWLLGPSRPAAEKLALWPLVSKMLSLSRSQA